LRHGGIPTVRQLNVLLVSAAAILSRQSLRHATTQHNNVSGPHSSWDNTAPFEAIQLVMTRRPSIGYSPVLVVALFAAACDSSETSGGAPEGAAAKGGGTAGTPGGADHGGTAGTAGVAGGTENSDAAGVTGTGGVPATGGSTVTGGSAGSSGGTSVQGGTGGSRITCTSPPPASTAYAVDTAGITFTLSSARLRLQVCRDDIIRVEYTPASTFPAKASLSVSNSWDTPTTFCVSEASGTVTVTTSRMKAKVDTTNGTITYTDSNDKVVLAEDSKAVTPVTIEGVSTNRIQTVFKSAADEALFGLGRRFVCHLG
jgi:hypothetical protein